MKLEGRSIALVLLCVALFAGAHLMRMSLVHMQGAASVSPRFAYVPDGEYLKVALLGYRRVGADLLWLQAVQAMGERKVSVEAGRWIYRILDVVTTLDPSFVRAYEAGGVALCTLVVLPEESNRLLEKGFRHNPESWVLPFLLGFNYYYELHDDAKAAEYFEAAAKLPGAPGYLPGLTAHLFISGQEPGRAVEFLSRMYDEATDENLKMFLAGRLEEAIVERDLRGLEAAVEAFRRAYGNSLQHLEDLVRVGMLRELPKEPSGVPYQFDPLLQRVYSNSFKRFELHGFRRRS